LFQHQNTLDNLSKNSSLNEKLATIHTSINENFTFISRIAIAIYDHDTETLKTFLHSSGTKTPLKNYNSLLKDAPSLQAILESGKSRVVNDLRLFDSGEHEHTVKIKEHGYEASYTVPMYNESNFIGFLFFNSDKKDVFDKIVLHQLDLYGHIISLIIINELLSVHTLTAAIKTTSNISHLRDPETGKHLDRMSHYSLLIASTLAEKYNLNDNYIEHVFMFAPLHDIGKIGIPDNILLKPGLLNDAEREIMKTHASKGREMIDDLLKNFGLKNFEHVDVLRNIAEKHHEAINGSGYPMGIKGDEIPLEARIIAVADIFDALTSERSYKKAWSNEDAFSKLQELAGEQLDKDCVEALINNIDKVAEIQKLFREDTIG
jgi:HD-GYP domain-containing protein (c-di-GMP phosphodiesterase class II)